MNTSALVPQRLAVAVAVSLGAAAELSAQAVVLEEVIVIAQKREQSLQDVPMAVSAFSAEMIRQSGVKDIFDLQVNEPSLIVAQNQTLNTTTFSIRGVFTSSQNFGLESSVGLYVDGVYRPRQGSMINNLLDVASVEVLRGPQGTLFGRNTPAGAILINSVAPDFEGSGFLEATGGDYNLFGTSGARSLTLIEDVLAIRATGFYMGRDGYVDWIGLDDAQENDAIGDRDRWGLRFQGLYTPTDDLKLRLITDHSEVDEVCCSAGSWKNNFFPQDGGTLPPKFNPFPNGPTDSYVVAGGGTVLDQDNFYNYELTSATKPQSRNEDEGISLQVDWETDLFTLTSISAWRAHDASDETEILYTNLDGAYRTNDAEQDQFTQELRFSQQSERWNYLAGLYYYKQDLDNNRTTSVGEDTSRIVLGFDSNLFIDGTGSRDVNEQEHESYAVFGQADYNLTVALVLTAGLRWTHEDKEMSNRFTQDFPLGSGNPGDNAGFLDFPPLAPTPDLDAQFDTSKTTGTIKLSWFMDDHIMFYGSYGTGYKSGGINTDRIDPVFDPVFDAEESGSYELGMKAEFPEQALRLNVALHKTDTDDLQTLSFQGEGSTLANAGTAETYGGELDLSWLPTDTTVLTLAYAYNHGKYEDFKGGPCWTGEPWHSGQPDPGDPDPSDLNTPCDRSGGDLAGNPENVLVVTGRREISLSDGITGFLYGEYVFTDERMTDVNNDPAKYDGSYNLVNLRAGLILESWDAQLTLWARNVFDEDSTNTIWDTPAQTGRYSAFYNEPATWGVTVRKDF